MSGHFPISDAEERRRCLLSSIGLIKRYHQGACHQEQIRLEGAIQLLEDVVNRKAYEPLPALYEPAEAGP